jgi:hypothetical protein
MVLAVRFKRVSVRAADPAGVGCEMLDATAGAL